MTRGGIGSHTLPNKGATDDWITPKYIIDALGPFDLDPCQSLLQPWPCASKGYTITDDGLSKKWHGFTYVNAPYSHAEPFMERAAEHKNGLALLFGRTETEMFRKHIWATATAILFVDGRLHFHYPDPVDPGHCFQGGKHVWEERPGETTKKNKPVWCRMCGLAKGNSGGPSCIVAYGDKALKRLRQRSEMLRGALVTQWEHLTPKG
jgi:hypothetical protein